MNTCIILEGIFDNVTDYQLEAEAPLRMGESEKIQRIYFGLRKEHVSVCVCECVRAKSSLASSYYSKKPPLTVCGIALCFFSAESKYKSVTNIPNTVAVQL